MAWRLDDPSALGSVTGSDPRKRNRARPPALLLATVLLTVCTRSEEHRETPTSPPVSRQTAALVGAAAFTPHQPRIKWHGRIQSIAVDPANTNFVIAGSESGGLFRSTNGGSTWTPLENLIPTITMDVRVCVQTSGDPMIPPKTIVIAAAPSGRGLTLASDPGGIWRSEDAGDTWARIETIAGVSPLGKYSASAVAFEPGVNCANVIVATDLGVVRCTDAGRTCTNFPVPVVIPPATDAGMATTINTSAFALNVGTGGLVDIHTPFGHRRRNFADAMGTWGDVRNPVGACPMNVCPPGLVPSEGGQASHSIALNPFNSQVVFGAGRILNQVTDAMGAKSQTTGGEYEVYESENGGETWTSLQLPNDFGNRIPIVAAVPTRKVGAPMGSFDLYVADGVQMYRQTCREVGGTGLRCAVTTPGTDPWELIDLGSADTCAFDDGTPCAHTDPSDMAFAANNCPLFMANDGGVLKAASSAPPDCGKTGQWLTTGSGLEALQIRQITGQVHPAAGMTPAGPTDLYFATQDDDI